MCTQNELSNEYIQVAEAEIWQMFIESGYNISNVAKQTGLSWYHIKKIIDKGMQNTTDSNTNILVISDMHIPYHHPDSFTFLKALKDKYKINKILNVGDVLDKHQTSYHAKEHEALGVNEEFKTSKDYIQELSQIFPEMDIAMGNHDALTKRKAKDVGIPKYMLKTEQEAYGLPDTWVFKESFDYPEYQDLHMRHTIGTNTKLNAKQFSSNSVQGHHHSEFCISYFADVNKIRWSMSVGCLIDHKHPVFTYNKSALTRPILGCGVILNNEPKLIPMVLNKEGRWNEEL